MYTPLKQNRVRFEPDGRREIDHEGTKEKALTENAQKQPGGPRGAEGRPEPFQVANPRELMTGRGRFSRPITSSQMRPRGQYLSAYTVKIT